MDRTAFKINTFEEADNNVEYWLSKTPTERLAAATKDLNDIEQLSKKK